MKNKMTKKQSTASEIGQKVIAQIEGEDLKPKSKFYFWVATALLIIGVGAFLVAAAFFINLIIFKVRHYAEISCQCLNTAIDECLIKDVPWLAIILAVSGMAGGWFLLKKTDQSYKVSWLIKLILGVVMAVALAFLIDVSGFNEKHYERMDDVYNTMSCGTECVEKQKKAPPRHSDCGCKK